RPTPRLDPQPRQDPPRLEVVLVGRDHPLEQADGAGVVAGVGGRLPALEREPGPLVQLDRLVALAGLLVEPGCGLVLARPCVAGGGATLEAGAHVHRTGGREAVPR